MLVQDLVNEWDALASARLRWEVYWRNIARYVLPQTDQFDTLINQNRDTAITSVVSTPTSADVSKDLYDMTSLWAIERLTAGMISLKTPEASYWHDNQIEALFGEEPTDEEKIALERLRNYQFKVRSNPHSGFWPAHRAAVKSMCAFGDGWTYIKELHGKGASLPFEYEYVPLIECYPGLAPNGQPNRMFRAFRRSAEQLVRQFGADSFKASSGEKVLTYADDPKLRHETFLVLHGIMPRDDSDQNPNGGVRGAKFASYYCLPDSKHLIGEGGFYEFPFNRFAWANTGTRPFSEGPVAYAIGEIKSLQEMSKNELISVANMVRPAYATYGKNFYKINLNPGAQNPGLMTGDGKQLFMPMNGGVRPDFAQSVLEARRNNLREMMYLNLWQIILQDKNDTATEALIRAQEKGEMLGPVGISMNEGLATQHDREIAILSRKGAFNAGSPLEMPDSAAGRNVVPSFSSPLDRLRRMSEMVGMQRLASFAAELAGGDPQMAAQIMARFDIDEMLESAQEILGAPVKSLKKRDDADDERQTQNQQQQMLTALAAIKGGGEAAQAVGAGAGAMAGGAEAMNASPALSNLTQAAPDILNKITQGYQSGQTQQNAQQPAVPGQ